MSVTILVEGDRAEDEARDLHARLGEASPSDVDVQRSVDLVALFSLAAGAISTADVIWSWWTARPRPRLTVRIAAPDGTVVDLENASRQDVVRILETLAETAR